MYNLRNAYYQFKVLYARKLQSLAKSWNSMPLHLQRSESLKEFKDQLNSYLQQKMHRVPGAVVCSLSHFMI